MNNIFDSAIDEQCILLIGCEDQYKYDKSMLKLTYLMINFGRTKIVNQHLQKSYLATGIVEQCNQTPGSIEPLI